ncbi:MAG: cobyrinate a,c-diamide synthase [Hyphomicrobiaceae bacterium]|nr:cobyrinate a,c-diamide synthase [Hyphomicrobiaceae bacterium]
MTLVPRGFIISAPASGSGKTMLAIGLIAALRKRGIRVVVAKTGPDYIDSQFLSAAAGCHCLNLDPWAMSENELKARVIKHTARADLLVIEGVMGLFDSPVNCNGSTADLATLLNLPVVLAVDSSRQAQSIAAIVHGFTTFRASPKVCGIIATNVASNRHANIVNKSLAEFNLLHLGSFRTDPSLKLDSRHLGLVQAQEVKKLHKMIQSASINAEKGIDLDRIIALASPLPVNASLKGIVQVVPPLGQYIAVAHDVAFSFAYPHILLDWQAQGAQIAPFSPLKNESPVAEADAIFLPGGYPELYAAQLSTSHIFLNGIQQAAERGTTIYGECGGYMVLGQVLIDSNGSTHKMAGLLSHSTSFAERKLQLGYRLLENAGYAWQLPQRLRGHEFHYSVLAEVGSDPPLFHATDSCGYELGNYGGHRNTVMGSYAHIISVYQ